MSPCPFPTTITTTQRARVNMIIEKSVHGLLENNAAHFEGVMIRKLANLYEEVRVS